MTIFGRFDDQEPGCTAWNQAFIQGFRIAGVSAKFAGAHVSQIFARSLRSLAIFYFP